MSFLQVRETGWKEPEDFRCEQDKRNAVSMIKFWWLRPLLIFGFTCFFILIWCGNKFLLDKQQMSLLYFIPSVVAFLWLLFYGYPWLLRKVPSRVTLYSKSIMKLGESSPRSLREMTSYSWSRDEIHTYHVLHLVTKRERVISYGVPDLVTKDKIERVLIEAGLRKV